MSKLIQTRQIQSGEFLLVYYERSDEDNNFELFHSGDNSMSLYMEPDDLVHELKKLIDKLEEMADDIKDGK